MIIPLGNEVRAEVIDSVLGQLSDGIWENSGAMNKYWMFADVEGTDLVISDEMYSGGYDYYSRPMRNGFDGKSETEIKNWFANKAKQVVKIWAEDYGKDPKVIWNRNNTDVVTYMGGHVVSDVTVADVYECYDFLKGRSGKKYAVTPIEEPAEEVIDEVVEPKVSGGMNPSGQEIEDFFLDASTRVRGKGIKASRKFTKYPSNYVKASIGGTTRQLSFDYIITGMHDNDIASHIYEVFEEQHGCTVNGIDYEIADYSDVPEYADADVRQIGVAFTCNGSCNENAILSDLEETLYNAGYEIIGSEFYSA